MSVSTFKIVFILYVLLKCFILIIFYIVYIIKIYDDVYIIF
jgi:hypothetical protein